MTREEQLDWLYRLRSEIYVFMPKEWIIPMNNALDMTIKALEQEPCEDCISRQAVINGIDNYIEKVQSTGAKDDFISFEELVVKALPPVTSQEPIIDKIRNEINEQYDRVHPYNLSCAEGLEMALEIIDKYKAESEDSHEID